MIPTMIITNYNRPYGHQSQIHTCPNHLMAVDKHTIPPTEVIPEYFSNKEALNNGWSTTNWNMYSPDGAWIWVCPKCAKEIKKRNETIGGNNEKG